jgi:predicted Zn-dependent peptidase
MTVAIAGDIDKDKIIAGLKPFFQAFPETRAPQRKLKDPAITSPVLALVNKPGQVQSQPAITSPVLALVNKPGQVQSQIILSLPANKRSHPDYWKTSLLMNIFGGNDSLMYKRLRDDLGLVYSAGFFQTYKWQAGQLLGYIGCKGDQTGAAIIETIKVMDALRKDIPERELELKRLDALNSFVFNVDTKSELVDVYGRYHLRKEPLDTLEKIRLPENCLTPPKSKFWLWQIKTSRCRRQTAKGLPWKKTSKFWPTNSTCHSRKYSCDKINGKINSCRG